MKSVEVLRVISLGTLETAIIPTTQYNMMKASVTGVYYCFIYSVQHFLSTTQSIIQYVEFKHGVKVIIHILSKVT